MPLLVVFEVLFLIYKFYVDGHRLLTLHRTEMESSGKLPHAACRKIIAILAFSQLALCIKFLGEKNTTACIILALVFGGTVLIHILYKRPFITIDDFNDKTKEEVTLEGLELWHREYLHPLAFQPEYSELVDHAYEELKNNAVAVSLT